MQNILTKIYKWSHKHYNLRMPRWLFRYSAKLRVHSGKCSETKTACGAREIALAAMFISRIACWMFHLKEKQTTFCIIIQRMTTANGTRAIGIQFVWFCNDKPRSFVSYTPDEPPHDKTNIITWAHGEDSDQPGHPPSLISLRCVPKDSQGPNASSCGQRRHRSDGCPGWSESLLDAQVILLVLLRLVCVFTFFLLFLLVPEEG